MCENETNDFLRVGQGQYALVSILICVAVLIYCNLQFFFYPLKEQKNLNDTLLESINR